jgi:hypothetical protein
MQRHNTKFSTRAPALNFKFSTSTKFSARIGILSRPVPRYRYPDTSTGLCINIYTLSGKKNKILIFLLTSTNLHVLNSVGAKFVQTS